MNSTAFSRGFAKAVFEALEGRRLLSGDLLTDQPLPADGAKRVYYYVDANGGWGLTASGSVDLAVYTQFVDVAGGTPFTIAGIPGTISVDATALPANVTPAKTPAIKTSAPASRDASDVEVAIGTVVQADGKVIVATRLGQNISGNNFIDTPTFDRLSLVRYNADGSLDTTFGDGGAKTYTLGQATSDNYGSALMDASGRILVAYPGAITRFNADGSIDSTFGTNGTTTLANPAVMKLQTDGKLLVLNAGVISRLNADGSADASFTPYSLSVTGSLWPTAQLSDFAIAADGSVYVVGDIRSANVGLDDQMSTGFITKLDSTGALDTGFATNGRFDLGIDGRKWENFNGVAVLPDGKIQVVGTYSFLTPFENPTDPNDLYRDDSGVVLARFNADGSLDTSYGDNGIIKDTTMSMDNVFGVVVLDDGRIAASTYGNDGARLFVASADGTDRRLIDGPVDLQNVDVHHRQFDMTTRPPTIAPDGTIVAAVGMESLYDEAERGAAKTYWTRFTLDDLGESAVKAPTTPDTSVDAPVTTAIDPTIDELGVEFVAEPTPTTAVPSRVAPLGLAPVATITRRANDNLLASDTKDDLFAADTSVLS